MDYIFTLSPEGDLGIPVSSLYGALLNHYYVMVGVPTVLAYPAEEAGRSLHRYPGKFIPRFLLGAAFSSSQPVALLLSYHGIGCLCVFNGLDGNRSPDNFTDNLRGQDSNLRYPR